ncbi:hypothetical protein OAL72_01830 [bacterium]|nr:hypothetical protein [bacterium]
MLHQARHQRLQFFTRLAAVFAEEVGDSRKSFSILTSENWKVSPPRISVLVSVGHQ